MPNIMLERSGNVKNFSAHARSVREATTHRGEVVEFPRPLKYPVKPTREERRLKMTIGIGIVSGEGHVILAADTKYTTGGLNNFGDKIIPLAHGDNYGAVVAGAGDVEFIKAAAHKLECALPKHTESFASLERVIERTNKHFYESYFLSSGDPERCYELLVAVGISGKGTQLFKISANAVSKVQTYETLGTGGQTCEPYKPMWYDGMEDYEAQLMAVFLVKYAKTYDQGCGGETHLFRLTSCSLERFEPIYISTAEEYFETFNRLMFRMIIPSDLGIETDTAMFSGELGSLSKEAQHLRDDLSRMQNYRIKNQIYYWGDQQSASECPA